jgi:hypothetical protein
MVAPGVSGRRVRRNQLRGNVVAWNCVGPNDPARSHTSKAWVVSTTGLLPQDRPDALGGRFVPQLAEAARERIAHPGAHRGLLPPHACRSMTQLRQRR